MRVAFLGNARWSVPAFRAVADAPGLELVAVVTNPPRPKGRGSVITATDVALAARAVGIEPHEVGGVRRDPGLDVLRSCRPDVLAVVAYGELLTPEVLSIAPAGAVNVHFSLLPRWRGAAPVQHAILAGDERTGVTTILMDEGLDTGPILEQQEVAIGPSDDAGSLGDRLSLVSGQLLVTTLTTLDASSPRAQDPGGATAAPKLGPEAREVRWEGSAVAIERQVRALSPAPLARTLFRGSPLLIATATVASGSGPPGAILGRDPGGVVVATGDAALRLDSVVPAGRRRMSARDWAHGARPSSGERFG